MKRTFFILALMMLVFSLSALLWGRDNRKNERGRFSHIKSVTSLETIDELEKSGDQAAVPLLTEALIKNSGVHRLAAIHALATLGGAEAEGFLKELWKELNQRPERDDFMFLDKSIAGEKAFVAAALHKLGTKDYVGFVYRLAKNENKALRYTALVALGMVNTAESKQILMDAIQNDEMDLPKCGAANALEELQYTPGLELIRTMAKSGEGPLCFREFAGAGP